MSLLRIFHLEDEIKNFAGVWTLVSDTIMEHLTDEECLTVEEYDIKEKTDDQYCFEINWIVETVKYQLQVHTFSNANLAKEPISNINKGDAIFILDVRDDKSGEMVLEDNLKLVRKKIVSTFSELRIYSAYCDEVIAHVEAINKSQIEDENLWIPTDWKLPNSNSLSLDSIMLSKTQADELCDFVINKLYENKMLRKE